jgi:hypothetical protein
LKECSLKTLFVGGIVFMVQVYKSCYANRAGLAGLLMASLAWFSLVPGLQADEESNMPSGPWEQHVEGVALKMGLSRRLENGKEEYALCIFIKNTLNTDIRFYQKIYDSGCKISYMNDNGIKTELHNYDRYPLIFDSPLPDIIPPGKILSLAIKLTESEYNLLKTHAAQCWFAIWEGKTNKVYKIESSSRKLPEITDATSNK